MKIKLLKNFLEAKRYTTWGVHLFRTINIKAIYIYIYTYTENYIIHTHSYHIYKYIHMYTHANRNKYISKDILHTCIFILCTHTHTHIYIYIYIYIYIHGVDNIYKWISTHTYECAYECASVLTVHIFSVVFRCSLHW